MSDVGVPGLDDDGRVDGGGDLPLTSARAGMKFAKSD